MLLSQLRLLTRVYGMTTVHECTHHPFHNECIFSSHSSLSNLPCRDEVNLQAPEVNKEVVYIVRTVIIYASELFSFVTS